jgi:hypothetical protein
MLDIHPAHHAATTRRDFFIHLTTIIIGLLIAIGLEQSVEALHRLHQRHVLEAALHAECEDNKGRAESNFSAYDDQMAWLLGLHRDIGTMLATGGKADLPYRELKFRPRSLEGTAYTGNPVALVTAAWDTAKEDNRLTLLPDQMARLYSVLYHIQGERVQQLRLEVLDLVIRRQQAFETRFADEKTPAIPVLARMSATDLKEYDILVMQSFVAVRAAKSALRTLYQTNDAVRQGIYDPVSIHRIYDAPPAFPDDFDKIAQQIDAADAARDEAAAKKAAP